MQIAVTPIGIVDERGNVALIASVDEKLHTDEHPFCSNPLCPCHETIDTSTGKLDPYFVEHIEQPRLDGLYSRNEIERIFNGWHI